MCDYCKNGEENPLASKIEMRQHLNVNQVTCILDKNQMVVSTIIQTAEFITLPPIIARSKINYCPICGRKLGD